MKGDLLTPGRAQPKTPEWDAWVREIEADKGRRICGANRKGRPCCGRPMENGRCRLDGGATPHGIASPHWQGKGRSRYAVAGKLGDRIAAQLDDLDYISLRQDMAAVTGLIELELDRLGMMVDDGGIAALVQSLAEGSGGKVKTPLDKLLDLWHLRRAMADTEVKRVKTASESVSGEQVRTFGAAVLQANRDAIAHFLPPDQAREFLADVQARVRTILASIGAVSQPGGE
jgi:hypothetical protein